MPGGQPTQASAVPAAGTVEAGPGHHTWVPKSRDLLDTPAVAMQGEIVDIEIDLLPIGLAFYPGQQLRFVISAHNALGAHMPAIRDCIPRNSGQHVIHTGGPYASYLQLPVKAAR